MLFIVIPAKAGIQLYVVGSKLDPDFRQGDDNGAKRDTFPLSRLHPSSSFRRKPESSFMSWARSWTLTFVRVTKRKEIPGLDLIGEVIATQSSSIQSGGFWDALRSCAGRRKD